MAIATVTRKLNQRSKSAGTLPASERASRGAAFLRRSLGWLSTAALALASVPAIAEPSKGAQGKAADLSVMSVSLKDAVKLHYGLQGQLQGAGTPNEADIGGFIPLRVGTQSVTFLDVLANVNFADYPGYSSIINTTVAGDTISTSSRLGQRGSFGSILKQLRGPLPQRRHPPPALPDQVVPELLCVKAQHAAGMAHDELTSAPSTTWTRL